MTCSRAGAKSSNQAGCWNSGWMLRSQSAILRHQPCIADEPSPHAGERLVAHSETETAMAESERARSLGELSERLEELRRHL